MCHVADCGGKHDSFLQGIRHTYCNFINAGQKMTKLTDAAGATAYTGEVERGIDEELKVPQCSETSDNKPPTMKEPEGAMQVHALIPVQRIPVVGKVKQLLGSFDRGFNIHLVSEQFAIDAGWSRKKIRKLLVQLGDKS